MPNPNASSPVDPQVLTLFQEELARAGALPGLAPAGPALWPRFAGYYQGLARLPRRLRRALQRQWRRSLGGIALLCALGQAPALAATINVDGTTCTLVDAITAANNDTPTGGCTAGSGADQITLPSFNSTTLVNNDTYGPTGLPVITSTITISRFFDGGSNTITRGTNAPEFRILAVGQTGNLTLQRTTVSGGVASGSGGGIYNRGTLTLYDITVSGNSASSGGGIASFGTLTLTHSTVSGNSARDHGGILHFGGTATLIDSTVSGNFSTSPDGLSGGIANVNGAMTLTNSTVSGNSAEYTGGISNSGSGTLTLTDSTVTGNTGGGIFGGGTVILTNTTVSGNSAAGDGGGISIPFSGTVTLTNSTVTGNTAGRSGGGIHNSDDGIVTLTNSTVSGNSAAGDGGGISIPYSGTVTLNNSSVDGNSAQSRGGGIFNAHGSDYQGTHSAGMVTLTNSAVSGNTAGTSGGGVSNGDLLTLTNSTVSGNTAADRGGGVDSSGTVTLTSSTVSRNESGGVAGGLFNTGTVTLVQSLLSGNTAVIGPEAYNFSGNVIGDGFNVFGHGGFSGVAGFTLGATDLVPAVPLSAILAPTLGYNGGPTKTHTLVFGSPAVDTIPGAACATGTDQRGAPRPQDADGDTFADCDSGSVERGLIPIQAEITNTTLDCNSTACRVSVRCNLQETECTNPIDIAVRTRALRASDGTLVKASKLIPFAAGATNVPPGGTQQLRVKLTKPGKRLVRATQKRRLKGVLGISEIAATVSSTPLTISRTNVTIRLKRRK